MLRVESAPGETIPVLAAAARNLSDAAEKPDGGEARGFLGALESLSLILLTSKTLRRQARAVRARPLNPSQVNPIPASGRLCKIA